LIDCGTGFKASSSDWLKLNESIDFNEGSCESLLSWSRKVVPDWLKMSLDGSTMLSGRFSKSSSMSNP
jgi:hypothetical protein